MLSCGQVMVPGKLITGESPGHFQGTSQVTLSKLVSPRCVLRAAISHLGSASSYVSLKLSFFMHFGFSHLG